MNMTLRAEWVRVAPTQAGEGLAWYRRFTVRRFYGRPETGVVFSVEPMGLKIFAHVTPDQVVKLWTPTPCCGAADLGDELEGECAGCKRELHTRYYARWAPPMSASHNTPRLTDAWLTEACDNVLEASLYAPELAHRMDQVFKHKILADPTRPRPEFERILTSVAGPL